MAVWLSVQRQICPVKRLHALSPWTAQVIIRRTIWPAILLMAAAIFPFGDLAGAQTGDAETPRQRGGIDMIKQPDFAALKTLPLIKVIERGTAEYTLRLPAPEPVSPRPGATSAFARIEGLDPDLRRLVWLTWLLKCWGPDEKEGLHTFFYLWGGDRAPQVRDALFEAGLLKQDRIFRRAMAAFGPHYPLERKARSPFFGWSQPAKQIDATTSIPAPLNAFDMKIMALGAVFGARDDYGRGIENFVRNNPALMAWADGVRAKFPDDMRLQWLTGRLSIAAPAAMAAIIAEWPAAYRRLYLLDLFNKEMLNGGVHQFFLNSSGDLAPQVAAALREAGLPRHADAVERGVAMFPAPYPVDRQMRGRYFFANGETTDWDKELDALTGDVDDGAIGAAMLAIAGREDLLPR
jgi:Domain of unknown function (DUF4375)